METSSVKTNTEVAPVTRLGWTPNWSLASVFITNIGDGIYTITVGMLLYERTGSVAAFGFVVVLQFILNMLLQMFSGSIIDRGSPRVVCLVSDLGRGLFILLASLFVATDYVFFWLVATTIVINVAKPFYRAASFAYVPAITNDHTLLKYNGYMGTLLQTGQLLGVAMAGPILQQSGTTLAFALNGISYLLAGLALWIARIPDIEKKVSNGKFTVLEFLHDWKEMLTILRTNLSLTLLVFLCIGDFLTVSFLNITFVPMVNERFSGNAYWLSVLDGSFAIGAIGGSLLITRLIDRLGILRVFMICTIIEGILFFLLSVSFIPWVIISELLLMGAFNTFSITAFMSTIQRKSKGAIKGRVASIRHLSLSIFASVLVPVVTTAQEHSLYDGLLTSGIICFVFGFSTILVRRKLDVA